MTPTVGVILSGCGFRDGAEIQESVCALLALDRLGATAVCAAPDIPQRMVVNHLTGETAPETRNVLVESARICRGAIEDVAKLDPRRLDALVLPGGYGAALNLSDFALKGAAAEVHPEVARLVREMRRAGKPVCAICIAPVLLARVLGGEGPRVTIGNDPGTAAAIEQCGARHETCGVTACVVDRERKLVTTPAYMLGPNIAAVADGIEAAIRATLDLIGP